MIEQSSRNWPRLLMMGTLLIAFGQVSRSQTLIFGQLPPTSDYTFSTTDLVSVVDLGKPALYDGVLENVTFRWSNSPCPAAANIAVYRESFLSNFLRLDPV